MTYKYTVEFETDVDLEDEREKIDIVEPSAERGLIQADKEGVATWWYQCPNYVIEWKIIKKEKIK